MEAFRTESDTTHGPRQTSIRDEIALALDGALPTTADEAQAAYRAALRFVSSEMRDRLEVLRQLGSAGLVTAPERLSDIHRLLRAVDISWVSSNVAAERSDWPGVAFIGCVPGVVSAHKEWIEHILDRGAVVVMSDHSASLPIVSSVLNPAERRPARRARCAVNPSLADEIVSHGEWGRLVADLNPAVRLAPGHQSLAIEQPATTRIIARDALTDEPLVVSARVGQGLIVHSVSHWWQDAQPDVTEIGQRSLASVPAFAAIGSDHPELTMGSFSAASVLLTCLLAGLAPVLDRVGGLTSTNSRERDAHQIQEERR